MILPDIWAVIMRFLAFGGWYRLIWQVFSLYHLGRWQYQPNIRQISGKYRVRLFPTLYQADIRHYQPIIRLYQSLSAWYRKTHLPALPHISAWYARDTGPDMEVIRSSGIRLYQADIRQISGIRLYLYQSQISGKYQAYQLISVSYQGNYQVIFACISVLIEQLIYRTLIQSVIFRSFKRSCLAMKRLRCSQ